MKSTARPLTDAFELATKRFSEAPGKGVGSIVKLDQLAQWDLKISQAPRSEDELRQDMELYLDKTPNTLTAYFQNQLFSGLNPYALAGDWLSAATNSTMATYEVSPLATAMEKNLVQHMLGKVGWAAGDGIMLTGGSNANLVALLMARNLLFPETKQLGVGSMKLAVFVSEEAHYSFDKAANTMGLGIKQVRKVPSTATGKMHPESLEKMIIRSIENGETPYFIAATAGTTVMGAYDPLGEVAAIAKKYNLWFHVDGAWGASVLLSKKHRGLMNGIELSDSLAWDTHKMMGTGLMSSFFLTRHQQSLRASHDGGGGDYIFHQTDVASWDQGPMSLQCGRRNDAFKVWLAWRSIGDSGFSDLIDCLFEKAQLARNGILERSELEMMYEPEMLNICFRYKSQAANKINTEIRQRLLGEGRFFVNISTRRGETFFRLITVNPHLTPEILSELLDSIIRIGKNIEVQNEKT